MNPNQNQDKNISHITFSKCDQFFKGLYWQNKRWFEARFELNVEEFDQLSKLINQVDYNLTARIGQVLQTAIERGKNEKK